MARRNGTLLIAVVIALGGCGVLGGADADAESLDRMRRQANEHLARYDAAVKAASGPSITPVGSLTGQIGDWEPDQGDNKAALATGRITTAATATLPTDMPPTGKVVWNDGTVREFPLLPAAQALAAIVAEGSGDCGGGCPLLEVTGAKLATARIETARGAATVPAWEFTLKGTKVRITRAAADVARTVTVTPPSWDPYNSPAGLMIESVVTTKGSSQLTARFTGSPGHADQPCGADYTAEAVESDTAVVVIIITQRHADNETCTAIGAPREAVVSLNRPLGERAVLDVVVGLPVRLTVNP